MSELSKEEAERLSLCKTFDSHGWSLIEAKLREHLAARKEELMNAVLSQFHPDKINFEAGRVKGLEELILLVESIKDEAKPDSEQE